MSSPAAAPSSDAPEAGTRRPVSPLEIVRVLVVVVALATFVLWGLAEWPFPWNIVVAVVTPLVALLVWALFVSPRAVVPVHPFVRVLVELLIFASATAAWWSMGQSWIGIAYAVVAVATGVMTGRRALS